MFGSINKYKNSEFFRNVFKLVSGTTIAQIIAIACAPIVYRIYERVDYGLLGLFMAITSVISILSTLQYLNTILIAKNEDEALLALTLNRLINIILSLIVVVFVIPLFIYSPDFFNIKDLGLYFLLIPISIYFNGQNQIFRAFANRKKAYKIIMVNTIMIAVISPILSIPIGLIHEGPLGLFVSLVSGQIAANLFLQFSLKRKYSIPLKIGDIESLFDFARANSNFPKYILPTEFVGILSRQLPVFMINKFFGLELVGVYNLSVRMLGLPSQLITNSISEVFRQKVSEQINKNGEALNLFKKTFFNLVLIVIIPILLIMLFGPWLFDFFFGSEWIIAGDLSRVLIWLFSFQMVASPLSFLFILRNKMHETLFCHIYILVSSLLIFYINARIFGYSIIFTLFVYVINYCLVYVYYIIRCLKFANVYKG